MANDFSRKILSPNLIFASHAYIDTNTRIEAMKKWFQKRKNLRILSATTTKQGKIDGKRSENEKLKIANLCTLVISTEVR